MNLKEEFFNSFIGVNKDVILYVVNNLTPEQKRMLNEVYSTNSVDINNTTRKYIMNIIFKNLYKKPLKDYLATSSDNIISLVSTLKPNERNSLLKEYTIKTIEPIEILSNEELDRNKKTIRKLKDAIKVRRFNLSRRKTLDVYKPFFDTFKDDKDIIFKIINTLNEDEINLLKIRFGNDFTSLYMVNDDEYEKIKLSIYPKIKRNIKLIRDGARFVTIFDYITDTKDIDIIKSRISQLDTFGRNSIYKLFGMNLDKYCITYENRNRELIRKEYLFILNGNKKNKAKKSLVDIFIRYKGDNETDEEFLKRINLAVSDLDKYDRYLFNRKYVFNDSLSKLEREHLKNVVNNKLKSKLIGNVLDVPMCKGLFERFNDGEKEAVLYYIDKLFNNEEKALFKKKFGDDFSGVSYLYEDLDNQAIRRLINRIEGRLLKDYKEKLNVDVKLDNIKAFRIISRSEEYNELRYIYGDVLALAILLYIRYNGKISFVDIEKLTGIKREAVLKYSSEYLESLNTNRGNLTK